MRAHDRAGRVLALPSQTPDVLPMVGLTRAQADFQVWAVDRSGRLYGGAEAINRVLDCLPVLGHLARLYDWPPVRWLEDRVYRWVATNRNRLARFYSTVPECERPGVRCE